MAKKTRKVLKQESQQRAIQQAVSNVNTALAVAEAERQAAQATPAKVAKSAETKPDDYRYVRSDLRRISLLAASFTAVLAVLSFFIR